MKRISTLLISSLLTLSVWSQAPQSISYQAVVRNSSNQLVTNQAIGLQISILQGSATGSVTYTETQTATTNVNGLYTIQIGTGTTTGNFSGINWANGPYYLKVATDPTGGINYTITGTSELISVPYSLYSNTSLFPTSYSANGTVSATSALVIASSSITAGTVTTLLQITNVPAGTYGVFFNCPIGNESLSNAGVNLCWAITTNNANPLFPTQGVATSFIPASGWDLQYVFGQSGYSEVTLASTGTIELKVAYYGTITSGTVYLGQSENVYLRAIRLQ